MQYSEKVMDHFNDPRNVGVIEDADGVGEVGNPVCGDMMKITIKVDDADKISDIRFQTLGCGAAIATSSMITEMAKGLPITEAVRITKQQIADELDGLPPVKMHCSVLASDGLKRAVDDYLVRNGREPIGGPILSEDPDFDPHGEAAHAEPAEGAAPAEPAEAEAPAAEGEVPCVYSPEAGGE